MLRQGRGFRHACVGGSRFDFLFFLRLQTFPRASEISLFRTAGESEADAIEPVGRGATVAIGK
jgi:hypothetical protein